MYISKIEAIRIILYGNMHIADSLFVRFLFDIVYLILSGVLLLVDI